ncbi:hypothetical protein INT48_000876 [Thamnidium elegans]|uniref:Uncharacterized protein n=1 Tax=Thamnidium elegans TaxID=101142 RepID=A0A8H7SX02_9FUNG|nr:hypothetical protein INT48_000876 [Thamnidium elegans]
MDPNLRQRLIELLENNNFTVTNLLDTTFNFIRDNDEGFFNTYTWSEEVRPVIPVRTPVLINMTPFTTAENRIYNYLHLLQVVPQSVDYSRTASIKYQHAVNRLRDSFRGKEGDAYLLGHRLYLNVKTSNRSLHDKMMRIGSRIIRTLELFGVEFMALCHIYKVTKINKISVSPESLATLQ